MTNETNITHDDATTHDDANTTTRTNTNNARAHNDHFTIAQLSRDMNINAKIARRRMRDAIRRDDERVRDIVQRQRDIARDDMRVKHEYHNDVRDIVASIIARD